MVMVASDIRWYGGYSGDCNGGCWLLIVNLVVRGFYQMVKGQVVLNMGREDDGLKGFGGTAKIMVVVLVSDEMIDGFCNSGGSWWLWVKY
ncbi:hypothetical protein QVD17_19257 [Tagetes erecta]|uniref:Uncharacterized protein n=1 Tax=Tagetes erecta TaxID=13708 RepID=A0AAD8NX55_TARER|nr:hypothetical protein QVD17_19257 [Tagetes erecta]